MFFVKLLHIKVFVRNGEFLAATHGTREALDVADTN
jgi:hypothetical protein